MLLVDVTIVTVALPDMSIDLHASLSTLEWVVDIYALALAALLMLAAPSPTCWAASAPISPGSSSSPSPRWDAAWRPPPRS